MFVHFSREGPRYCLSASAQIVLWNVAGGVSSVGLWVLFMEYSSSSLLKCCPVNVIGDFHFWMFFIKEQKWDFFYGKTVIKVSPLANWYLTLSCLRRFICLLSWFTQGLGSASEIAEPIPHCHIEKNMKHSTALAGQTPEYLILIEPREIIAPQSMMMDGSQSSRLLAWFSSHHAPYQIARIGHLVHLSYYTHHMT